MDLLDFSGIYSRFVGFIEFFLHLPFSPGNKIFDIML